MQRPLLATPVWLYGDGLVRQMIYRLIKSINAQILAQVQCAYMAGGWFQFSRKAIPGTPVYRDLTTIPR